MEPAWRNKIKEIPSNVKAIYQDAQLNNCWIYHQTTRKFYTPAEFLFQWQSIYREGRRHGSNEKDFLVMNPMAAIRQRAKWVNIANQELQDVLEKLQKSNPEWRHGK